MKYLELIFEHKACDIFYNSRLNAAQTLWKGYLCEGVEFRQILNDIITVLGSHHAEIIVADARRLKIITFEDQQWIVDVWYPNAVKAGFKVEALIISPESYSEMSIKKIVKKYDETLVTTFYFGNYEEVEKWHQEYYKLNNDPFTKTD